MGHGQIQEYTENESNRREFRVFSVSEIFVRFNYRGSDLCHVSGRNCNGQFFRFSQTRKFFKFLKTFKTSFFKIRKVQKTFKWYDGGFFITKIDSQWLEDHMNTTENPIELRESFQKIIFSLKNPCFYSSNIFPVISPVISRQ